MARPVEQSAIRWRPTICADQTIGTATTGKHLLPGRRAGYSRARGSEFTSRLRARRYLPLERYEDAREPQLLR